MRAVRKLISRSNRALLVLLLITAQMTPFFVFTGRASAANEISVSDHEGQLAPSGTWTNGNVTTYSELDSINFRFDVVSTATAVGTIDVEFAADDSKCLFFDGTFNLGTHDSSFPSVVNSSGTSPAVSLLGSPTVSGNDWVQTVQFNFTSAGSAVIYYYLTLTDDAGSCVGSSTHTQFGDNGGAVKSTGSQDVSIPAKDILENPGITITKTVSSGTADPDEFYFTISPAINGVDTFYIADGKNSLTINNINPDGQYVITEHGPSGY